jgi:hypothetical protein
VTACAHCGRKVEARFRFCPFCGATLRRKLVEFFRPHPNSAGRALRVSRYVGEEPQVRFSVWDDGVARAAVSLEEDEAQRLAAFLAQSDPATGFLDAAKRGMQALKAGVEPVVGRRQR